MEGMELKITLDLEPDLQRRVKKVAKLRGVTVNQYCYAAIFRMLLSDEKKMNVSSAPQITVEDLKALHKKRFGDRILPGNSVDDIREAREERTHQLEGLE